jgi:spermidine synthase
MQKKKESHADNPVTPTASRWALYFLILLSGAAGLIYEVVWARQLTLFMGNTAIANAAVLTAFMAGLASGSLVIGRRADAMARPLLMYALLEILIGCYGATTPWLFDILQAGYADFAGVVGVTGAWSHLPRFLAAIAAMLIPTFLMGGTLPLLVKHFARKPAQAQTVTSRIYGINTVGATAGAFCAGYLLLPGLGITRTLLFSAAVNIIVGIVVYQFLTGTRFHVRVLPEEQPASRADEDSDSIALPSLLLVGFGLSGFAALLYQVVWIHSLILVIGVSIYAFSAVLTVFLGGVGLGSLLIGRIMAFTSARQTLKVASFLQLGISLSAIASLSLLSQLPVMFVHGWGMFHESFPLFQTWTFLLTAMVILLPTLLLGALFPLITGLWSNRKGAVGQGVGEAYGANALGTIAGSAIGGLFILDWLGIEGSLYLASVVSALVAALFWYMSTPDRSSQHRWLQVPLSALLIMVSIQVLPGWDRTILQAQVFRHSERYLAGDIRAEIDKYMSQLDFLYYKEGIHGTISVTSRLNENGVRKKALLNNGKADASTAGDMDTQILLGQLPMFLHDDPKEVMVIGLGSGVTAGSVLRSSVVENIDVLEISPEVVEASYFFNEENHDALNDPRTRLIVADARNYLLASGKTYDVIISEPSHSWVTGVSNLFTREFLEQARKRLKENGILVQWYHLYGVNRGSLKALLKSVSDVFPHHTLWYVTGGDIIITSSNKPLEIDYQKQSSFFDSPEIKADLARIGVLSVESLMEYILMSSDETQQLLTGQEANTDKNPIVEFSAPKYLYESTTEDNIHMLFGGLKEGEYPLPFVNLVEEFTDWIVVPFLGVQLQHGGDEYSAPEWNVIRKSVYEEQSGSHRLWGGMNGEIILKKTWGDVVVRTTMGHRDLPDNMRLFAMLDYVVPEAEQTLAGELKVPGIVIYWRVGPSSQPGMLNVVLARLCKRESGFDNWVSFSSTYPGNAENKEDATSALQEVNSLVRCLQE